MVRSIAYIGERPQTRRVSRSAATWLQKPAASPAVARVLRPLCRVLGVQPMPAALLAVKAAPVAPVARPKRVRVRRSARAIREALSVEGCEGFKNRPAGDWMWPRRR